MFKPKIIFLLLCLSASNLLKISAQDKILTGEIFYATFRGENYYNFKPTIGFNLEFKNSLVYGIGIMNFKPRKDVFYFADNSTSGYGTVTYKNYLVIPIYVGKDFDINITDQFKIAPGIQFGYTIVSCESYYEGSGGLSDESYSGGKIGFAPRLKFSYETENGLVFYFNTRYNGMYEIAGTNEDGSNRVGAYHHYLTFGLGFGINLY